MRGFFNIDGPFYKYGNILADIMILSLIWWVLSIFSLGILAGATTSSLFYVTTRRVTDRDGYLFRDFFKSFKANFKQSTLAWLIIVLVGAVLYVNITQMSNLDMPPAMRLILWPFQIVFFIELILNTLYVFVIIARFDMKLKDTFKTAFYMVHRHLLSTGMLVILLIGGFMAADYYPLFYIILPGCYAYITSLVFIKIFKKYRPEIDEDPYVKIDQAYEERKREQAKEAIQRIRSQGQSLNVREGIPEMPPEIAPEERKENI